MLHITTKTEMINGLKTVHVQINGTTIKSYHDEFKLTYNRFNMPTRQDTKAINLAAEFICSLQKRLKDSLGNEIV